MQFSRLPNFWSWFDLNAHVGCTKGGIHKNLVGILTPYRLAPSFVDHADLLIPVLTWN